MANVEKLAFAGRTPSCANPSRIQEKINRERAQEGPFQKLERRNEFVKYNAALDEPPKQHVIRKYLRTSFNIADYIISREIQARGRYSVNQEYITSKMISRMHFKENHINLENANTVHGAQWLTHRKIAMSTKCQKIHVYDLDTGKLESFPLASSGTEPVEYQWLFVRPTIRLNPSKTLMTSVAKDPNDVLIYRTPSMVPLGVGQNVFTDWIFDTCWIDDEFFVAGSRENSIALWKINADRYPINEKAKVHPKIPPVAMKDCKHGYKIEALTYNRFTNEIAAVTPKADIHIWDRVTFKQKYSRRLRMCDQIRCIAVHDSGVYGIGDSKGTFLLDQRVFLPIKKICLGDNLRDVRCLSFEDNIITISTEVAQVVFYDMRADNYLPNKNAGFPKAVLKCNQLRTEGTSQQQFHPCIYTHCYDDSRTKLFTGGGSPNYLIDGNYAAVWH